MVLALVGGRIVCTKKEGLRCKDLGVNTSKGGDEQDGDEGGGCVAEEVESFKVEHVP